MQSGSEPRLSTRQTAARLAVKPATLYAYVSRGLLTSSRDQHGGSTFDPFEVEAFADARSDRRRRNTAAGAQGRPLMVLDSAITLVEPDRLLFRGVPAGVLARRHGFEEAVAHLWGRPGTAHDFAGDPSVLARVAASNVAVGRFGMIRLAALLSEQSASGGADASPFEAGATLIGTMTGSLAARGAPAPHGAGLARRLWPALTAVTPDDGDLRALETALVLGMDHDLAASTLAARVAASARAAPAACVSAALAALTGTVHGGVGGYAVELLTETVRTGRPEHALARQLDQGHGTPGFGHVIYRRSDPRAEALCACLRSLPRYAETMTALDRLAAVVRGRLERPPNIDLALAALAVGAGMSTDAGQTIFAIARTAGWTAHIADEYEQAPLRLRTQTRYIGRPEVTRAANGPRS